MLPKTAKDTKDSQSRLDFFLMQLSMQQQTRAASVIFQIQSELVCDIIHMHIRVIYGSHFQVIFNSFLASFMNHFHCLAEKWKPKMLPWTIQNANILKMKQKCFFHDVQQVLTVLSMSKLCLGTVTWLSYLCLSWVWAESESKSKKKKH